MEQTPQTDTAELLEVETPRGIRIRLASFTKEIDHLCIRASEMISFIEDLNNGSKNKSYIA